MIKVRGADTTVLFKAQTEFMAAKGNIVERGTCRVPTGRKA